MIRAPGRLLFYRIARAKPLYAFGDQIGEVTLLGERLIDIQNRLVKNVGGELKTISSEKEIPLTQNAIWFDDDLNFSEGFLRAALKFAGTSVTNLNFCLRQNSFNALYALPDGEGFPDSSNLSAPLRPRFGFFAAGAARVTTQDCFLEQTIFRNPLPIPASLVASGEVSYDQCTVAISRIFTPFHLLQANLSALFCQTARLREKIPAWIQNRFLKPYSRLFYFVLRRQNKIGKRCRIHPSAVLEGVTLGDDVIIGANVVLRLSTVGAGTLIEDGAIVKYSVLGRKNYICNGNQLVSCVTGDSAFLIHGPYQFSIFGNASVVMAVLNCDVRLDQKTIRIPSPNGLLDSGLPLLGIAYGHRAKVGAGNSIAPGRIVPNDLQITPPSIVLNFNRPSEVTA